MASRTMRRRAGYRAVNGHARHKSHPILRFLVVAFAAMTMIASGASAFAIIFYGESLPAPKDFSKQFQFQNTIIRDWQGHRLYDMADLSKTGGTRVVEPLLLPGHTTAYYQRNKETWLVGDGGHGIPPVLQDATVASQAAHAGSSRPHVATRLSATFPARDRGRSH